MKTKFAERLRELRGSESQTQFATRLSAALGYEVKQTTYSSWERDAKHPSIDDIAEITALFGVSADWLLGLSEVRTTSKTADEAARGVRSRSKVLDPNQVLRDEIDALKRRMNALESSTSLATCG